MDSIITQVNREDEQLNSFNDKGMHKFFPRSNIFIVKKIGVDFQGFRRAREKNERALSDYQPWISFHYFSKNKPTHNINKFRITYLIIKLLIVPMQKLRWLWALFIAKSHIRTRYPHFSCITVVAAAAHTVLSECKRSVCGDIHMKKKDCVLFMQQLFFLLLNSIQLARSLALLSMIYYDSNNNNVPAFFLAPHVPFVAVF
jgi:hypothetical protein